MKSSVITTDIFISVYIDQGNWFPQISPVDQLETDAIAYKRFKWMAYVLYVDRYIFYHALKVGYISAK